MTLTSHRLNRFAIPPQDMVHSVVAALSSLISKLLVSTCFSNPAGRTPQAWTEELEELSNGVNYVLEVVSASFRLNQFQFDVFFSLSICSGMVGCAKGHWTN